MNTIQLIATVAALGGLLWVIAGLIASVFPDEEYEDEIEAEYPQGPGLPHRGVGAESVEFLWDSALDPLVADRVVFWGVVVLSAIAVYLVFFLERA